MVDNRTTETKAAACTGCLLDITEDDKAIMKKIRRICGRGNNAEIKQKKDGTLTVMEVKKNRV